MNKSLAISKDLTILEIAGAITTGGYDLMQNFTSALINDPTDKHKIDIPADRSANLGIDTQLSFRPPDHTVLSIAVQPPL